MVHIARDGESQRILLVTVKTQIDSRGSAACQETSVDGDLPIKTWQN